MNFGILHADNHERTRRNYFYWYFMLEAWLMTPDYNSVLFARKLK